MFVSAVVYIIYQRNILNTFGIIFVDILTLLSYPKRRCYWESMFKLKKHFANEKVMQMKNDILQSNLKKPWHLAIWFVATALVLVYIKCCIEME